MEKKNIIIGAGLSGLSSGWILKDKCAIFEKEPFVGGLAATKRFRNFKFDLGGHRFFTDNHSLDRFFRDLLRGELVETLRKSKIYKNGKLINYPLRASVVFQLNPIEIALSFFTYLFRKIKPLKEFSFHERAINQFGDHLYELFFKDYTQKVWGLACNNISTELVDTRLQNISLMRVIKHIFIKDKKIKSFADKIVYPKEGIYKISELLSGGLEIKLNSEITGLLGSGSRIEKVIINNSSEYPCENVISTMPVTELVKFFDPPPNVNNAIRGLKYRDLICVFLILNRKKYTENHWIYLPGKCVSGRLHEPKIWSSHMAPEDKTSVCVEIFCNKEDDIWKMPDTEIAHQAIRELPLLRKFEIESHFTTRVKYAYPIYDIHYRKNMKVVTDYLSLYKNLFLLGRTGSFKYINMDGCIEEGLRMGNYLLSKEKVATPAF